MAKRRVKRVKRVKAKRRATTKKRKAAKRKTTKRSACRKVALRPKTGAKVTRKTTRWSKQCAKTGSNIEVEENVKRMSDGRKQVRWKTNSKRMTGKNGTPFS